MSPRDRAGDPIPSTPATVAAALERLGVRPSRRTGQSFLVDRFVADALAALAEPGPDRPIVEIGGGLGLVTRALADRGADPLVVVERDRRLARHLRTTFGHRATVEEEDALRFEAPAGATVVGSLPFSSATAILLRLFAQRVPRVVALVQREVAERLGAGPGSRAYGRLSIIAALYGTVERFRTVPSSAFYPVPEVEGQIIVHEARDGPLPVPSVEQLEGTVRTLFSSRRKQLANLLPRILPDPVRAAELTRAARWPTDWAHRRPEELPPEAYFRLATLLARGAAGSPDSG